MFLDNSRYAAVEQEEVELHDGRMASAVKLRHLPLMEGEPFVMKGNDRLDILAERRYDDPTRFWHIADANTALEAGCLTERPNDVINLPRR
jgi:hypothetical protein